MQKLVPAFDLRHWIRGIDTRGRKEQYINDTAIENEGGGFMQHSQSTVFLIKNTLEKDDWQAKS